jgi:hypothetical protein
MSLMTAMSSSPDDASRADDLRQALPGARAAVHDYRGEHGITEEIHDIHGVGAFWRRAGGVGGGGR